ncbi:MAG: nitrous oxide-stimulated promoter family protein [Promethearchaeota archaeon]
MPDDHPRMRRERKTVKTMIETYCKVKHENQENSCSECNELLKYAFQRIDKCRYQEKKPTCANCSIHCYKPSMRIKIREVMRYSGPRMLWRHPIMTFWHILDGRKREPENKMRK